MIVINTWFSHFHEVISLFHTHALYENLRAILNEGKNVKIYNANVTMKWGERGKKMNEAIWLWKICLQKKQKVRLILTVPSSRKISRVCVKKNKIRENMTMKEKRKLPNHWLFVNLILFVTSYLVSLLSLSQPLLDTSSLNV